MEQTHNVDELIDVQYVWELPDRDYLRAVFKAKITAVDPSMMRYEVKLMDLIAGRQEAPNGQPRPKEELSREYWTKVWSFVEAEVHVAYEVADGQPIRMRLATLTGEHKHFSRWKEK